MIVEDNAAVAEDCRDCLLSLGYCVTAIVASGEEAIAKAGADRPDAVLMDIQLRDKMDGIEAAGIIHARFEIPVVFLSAFSDRSLLERARHVGSFGYLVKPYEERELYAMLEMAIYKAQAEKERRQIEARLKHAQKLEGLQVMAGSIAHNFNNMLHAALGFSEMALEDLPQNSNVQKFIEKSITAITHASEMSLLMLVYVGQGQGEMTLVNLSNLVQRATDMLQSTISGRISLLMNLANEDAVIKAAPAQLQQLIINLFTNATEAIGEKTGEISVTTEVVALKTDELRETYLQQELPAGDYVRLTFTDTGHGMDEETQSKIFDPFFTTRFIGRGLGLSAVFGIVQGHNGGISIESALGKGTTFSIIFPVTEKPEDPFSEDRSCEEWQHSGLILLIDAVDIVRKPETLMLQRMGFDVIDTANGSEAVEMFSEHADEVVCVLLDLGTPHPNGEQVFMELYRIRSDVKVILCSGYDEEYATRNFPKNALGGFIQKPFSMLELKMKLHEVISS